MYSSSVSAAAGGERSDANTAHNVVVFIPAALKRPTHTLYCICVKVDESSHGGSLSEWSVNRRYSQFLELRKQILQFLTRSQTCPGCQSMARAVGAYPFPPKAFFRTNKLVRQRTKDLQGFIEVVIQRTFSTAPKCVTCGSGILNLVWPFFNRGAQNIVRQSLHEPPKAKKSTAASRATHSDCSTTDSVQDMNDFEVHRRTTAHRNPAAMPRRSLSQSDADADPLFLTCRSDTSMNSRGSIVKVHFRSLRQMKATFEPLPPPVPEADPLEYLKGAEKCTDPRSSVANVEEALKEVIIADGHANTKEEKMYRLSTMWEAFELKDIQKELASYRGDAKGILV
ncbi:unnamed protein product [Aphanomyces euteiches]|uniref:PX domain-containing protein n=1 Tax=Aphanomyces euteiches TaxID=100861 RepID=A0A6G0WPY4_9STRA|nr:hypothetical protein Ae201684_012941 [Aphanomyces euteiches]KAH9097598.1 hypothetical protein Ae201684P_001074 [Aphanomyces euteiches]KAH9134848.1 hypothetical protein AeRB84_019487 [Aphanomyces euteiches]